MKIKVWSVKRPSYSNRIIYFLLLGWVSTIYSNCSMDFADPISFSERPYTIVLLPDTQKYKHENRGSTAHIFSSQTQWIVDHVLDENIVLVLHLGDIVDYSNKDQWSFASQNLSIMDRIVPYVLAVGNHDILHLDGTKSTRLFNEFFKVDNFKKSPSFGGVFQENRLENSYYIYSFQKTNYVVLSLQYCPNDQILEWANKIVTKYSESKVIVVTHSYLGKDGKHIEPGDKTNLSNCETFWPEGKGNEGKQIWEKLIRKHSNIQFVFSGHLPGSRLISKGLNGNPVFQLSADYQDLENGGNGFMQLLKFSIEKDKESVSVKTYSPLLDEYKTDSGSQFEIDLKNGKLISTNLSPPLMEK